MVAQVRGVAFLIEAGQVMVSSDDEACHTAMNDLEEAMGLGPGEGDYLERLGEEGAAILNRLPVPASQEGGE